MHGFALVVNVLSGHSASGIACRTDPCGANTQCIGRSSGRDCVCLAGFESNDPSLGCTGASGRTLVMTS